MKLIAATVFVLILSGCAISQNVSTASMLFSKKRDFPLFVAVGPRVKPGTTTSKNCPLFIISATDSCTDGMQDPLNEACRDKDKWVYWMMAPQYTDIEISNVVSNPADGLKNCNWVAGQSLYKCKTGDYDVKTHVSYSLEITDSSGIDAITCDTDPVIIINN